MAKGVLALLMKRTPAPGKLGRGGSGIDDGGDPSDEGEGSMSEDDGDSAALESAVADFFEAGKRGKYADAAKALHEAIGLCSDEPDEDDGKGY
jgi:hypothetical protein